MKKNAVLRYSMYSPNDIGHGGMKRTAQIHEILSNHDIKIFDVNTQIGPKGYIDKLVYIFFGLRLMVKHKRFLFSIEKIFKARDIGYLYFTYKQQLYELESKFKIRGVIWEFTWAKDWFVPLLFKKIGVKVIAIPHNLESLVFSQKSIKSPALKSPFWLFEEIEYLSWSDVIYTISREEQWLLSLFIKDIKINYLPYSCTSNTETRLLDIREKRVRVKNKNKILILGSAINPPTLEGMKSLMGLINASNLDMYSFEFVGYGVDELELMNSSINIRIFDRVSSEELETKLKESKLVVIYQIPSSGALTKIHELQVAGIPVIVNNHGARSYFNIKGVEVVESLNQLKVKIEEQKEFETPEIPVNNEEFSKSLIDCIVS